MSRVVTCGFEQLAVGSTANQAEGQGFFESVGTAADVTTTAAKVRTGRGSLAFTAPASASYCGWAPGNFQTDVGYWLRTWLLVDALPSVDGNIIQCRDTAFTIHFAARLKTNGTIILQNTASTQIGSASAAITAGVWVPIDVYYKTFAASAVQRCGLWVNNVEVVPADTVLTGNPASSAPPGRFEVGAAAGIVTTFYFDTVTINDTTGSSENGRISTDRKLVLLRPVADSARVGFTAGAAGTTNLWDAVDNEPPVGVAAGSATVTSQLRDTGSNTTDTYDATLAAYTASLASGGGALGAFDVVKLVQPIVTCGPESGSAQVAMTPVSNPAGSEAVVIGGSTAVGTYPTGWRTGRGALEMNPAPALGTGPVLRVRKNVTTPIDVAFMGLYVEYEVGVDPGTGGGGGGGGGTPGTPPAKVALRNLFKQVASMRHLLELTGPVATAVTDQIATAALTQTGETGTSQVEVVGFVPYNVGPSVPAPPSTTITVPDPANFTATAPTLNAAGTLAQTTLHVDAPVAGGGFTPNASPILWEYSDDNGATWTTIGSGWGSVTTQTNLTFPLNATRRFSVRYRDNTTPVLGNRATKDLILIATAGGGDPIDPIASSSIDVVRNSNTIDIYWPPSPSVENITEYDVYIAPEGSALPALPTWQGAGTLQAGGTTVTDARGVVHNVGGKIKMVPTYVGVDDTLDYQVGVKAQRTVP